ncbi:MAG: hypothetical protein ACFCU4_07755 [Puniceicoccaceae bacterium]
MPRNIERFLCLSILGLLWIPCLAAQTNVERFNAGPFEVVSTSTEPAVRIRDVGNILASVVARYLPPQEFGSPRPVLRLAPPGAGGLAPDESYRLYEESRDQVGVVLRWDRSTAFSAFCDALTEVYLAQIAANQNPEFKFPDVPDFFVRAISLELQTSIRPSTRLFVQQLGQQVDILSLEDLVRSSHPEAESLQFRINAYWFVELISRTLGRPAIARDYFSSLLASSPPIESLQNFVPSLRGNDQSIAIWWAVGYNELVHSRASPVENRPDSIARLARMSKFDLIIEGRSESVNLQSVFKYAKNPEVKRLLQMRIRSLEESLPQVHPVFQNASRALLVVLQAIAAEQSQKHQEALDALRKEWATATRISLALDSAITSR